jgi:hypothetical protein
MEIIKKRVKLKTKIVSTDEDNIINIIPDDTATYSFKILLLSDNKNFGFFNVDETNLKPIQNNNDYVVSGETYSRLVELEKTIQTTNIEQKYWLSNDLSTNGLDINKSVENEYYVYYIDNIEYKDDLVNNITYFKLKSNGLNDENSILGNIYINNSIIYNISKPKVQSDIFVERPIRKVVEPFFRMKDIKNLNDLYEYGGGSYFKIIKND